MANEVVKFNNDMNTVALRKFNSTEINLLMAICSRIREQGLKHIEFDFRYLKHLIKFPYDDIKSFVNTLDKSYSKLLECHIIGIYKSKDIKSDEYSVFKARGLDPLSKNRRKIRKIRIEKYFIYRIL